MRKYMCLILLLIMFQMTACSYNGGNINQVAAKPGQGKETPQKNNTLKEPLKKAGDTRELTIWSYYDLGEEIRGRINELIPDVDVGYKVISAFEVAQKYLDAYKKGELPDVYIFDPIFMGNFSSTNTFVDLATPPYNAEPMISWYPDNLKCIMRSFDGKRLLAMPVVLFPSVTFYRQDVIKAAGFPSEPGELAAYMESMDNWFDMAKALKKNNRYMVAMSSEPLIYADTYSSLFDENLNYMRNTELFINAFKLTRTIDALGLASNDKLLDSSKGNSIQTGKTVMFQSGMGFASFLKEAANGTGYGQWRVTSMPFGLYGWASSAVAAIPSESDNKEDAWAVIKMLTNRHLDKMSQIMKPDGKTKVYNDSFFGGQNVDALCRTLIERIPRYTFTSLDEKARTIWWTEWSKDYTDISEPVKSLIGKWSQTVLMQLDKDIAALKPYIKKR